MLVVISDLHLTDGTSGVTIEPGAFRVFVEALRTAVREASWRAGRGGPRFAPLERCDVILLGDILDVIRSDRWLLHENVRPWSDPSTFVDAVHDITRRILGRNEEALRHLRGLREGLEIETDATGGRAKVPIHVHYFVGNHDWFFHLPGPRFETMRRRIVEALGLADDPRRPFPHRIFEASTELQDLLRAHRVHAQHGDVHDELNYEAEHGRDHSSLGDCIVLELVNAFPEAARKALGEGPEHPVIRALREIDNVRPLLAVPDWVSATLQRLADRDERRKVLDAWSDRVDHFLEMPFVRARDRPWLPDPVDTLALGLRITDGPWLGPVSAAARWLAGRRAAKSYVAHAAAEDAIVRREARFVVYGHTHAPEVVGLDVVSDDGEAMEQLYFNSGTWRRVHRPCVARPRDRDFVQYDVMTFVAFYRGDERKGRRHESWTGHLG